MGLGDLMQSVFENLMSDTDLTGESVTYTPSGGEGSAVDAVVNRSPLLTGFDMGETEVLRWEVEISSAVVPSPAKGDEVTIGGVDFKVEKAPMTEVGVHTLSVVSKEQVTVEGGRLRRDL